jgi:hypothetical protein
VLETASFISDFWNDQLVEHGRQYLFLVILGFLGSFGFIRLSTRLMRSPKVPWWPGSVVSEGGLHVHHHVFGIITMMVAGVTSFALNNVDIWYDLSGLAFGIGMGLTIDEFALWLYLDDVYWAEEGRRSIDATLIVATAMGLILLGAAPFSIDTTTSADLVATIVATIVHGSFLVIAASKLRMFHAVVGIIVLVLPAYAAFRLAKPNSPWARRFYGARRPDKQARAERRFRPDRRTDLIKERFRDLIGGAPAPERLPTVDE